MPEMLYLLITYSWGKVLRDTPSKFFQKNICSVIIKLTIDYIEVKVFSVTGKANQGSYPGRAVCMFTASAGV